MIRCVRNTIFALLLIITIKKSLERVTSRSKLRFTNVQCEDFDIEFSKFQICRLNVLGRDKLGLHVHCQLYKIPVNNVSVNIELLKREKEYKPFLYNQSADFCKAMANRKTFPMLNVVFLILGKETNINHTCPYAHDIIIKDLVIKNDILNLLPLPAGDFMFQIHVGAYNEWKAVLRVYFKLSTCRININKYRVLSNMNNFSFVSKPQTMKRSSFGKDDDNEERSAEKRCTYSVPIDKAAIGCHDDKKVINTDSNDNVKDNNAVQIETDEQKNDEGEAKNAYAKMNTVDLNEINNLESDSQSSYLVIDSSNVGSDSESEDEIASDTNLELNQAKKSSTSSRLRQFKSLPIFVVDYHHHVLEFIYRCVGSRHLPVEGSMLIHFDSHPDMVISHDIAAKDTFNKNVMLEETSIESWIMPLCYTGIISRIVWIKNSWCNQIPNGKHDFRIGEYKGKLYVDLALPYFLAEGNYCDTKELSNARSIELFVMNASEFDAGDDPLTFPEAITLFKDKQMPYILDIDLDFFSVNNPFLGMYGKIHCYEQLRQIFALEANEMEPSVAASISERRIKQLNDLKHVFQHLEKHSTLKDYQKPADVLFSFDLLVKLVESLNANYKAEDIKWMIIYDAGCTADSGGLPHHNSTSLELMKQYESFRRFLQRLPFLPVAVTVARSAEDNYCPVDQVDSIQEEVIRCFDLELGSKLSQRLIYAYLDEEYNIMEL